MQTIDQKCATNAFEAYKNLSNLNNEAKEKNFNYAKKLPMMIIQSGLANALMFKLKDHKPLFLELMSYLTNTEIKENEIRKKAEEEVRKKEENRNKSEKEINDKIEKKVIQKFGNIIEQNLLQDAIQLRYHTSRALRWLEWFNRFADAEK